VEAQAVPTGSQTLKEQLKQALADIEKQEAEASK
jgi:hypothetical protein